MMSDTPAQTVAQFIERYQMGSPFDPGNEKAYMAWRDIKLENYPETVDELIVEINNPATLTRAEFRAIHALVVKTNMAVYSGNTGRDPDKKIPSKLGKQFGLTELDDNMGADDGVTSLKVVSGQWRGAYIPYSKMMPSDFLYNCFTCQVYRLSPPPLMLVGPDRWQVAHTGHSSLQPAHNQVA